MVGVLKVLAMLPPWGMVAIVVLPLFLNVLGCVWSHGEFFVVSFAAATDFLFVMPVIIGVTDLQKSGAYIPSFFTNQHQIELGCVCFLIGIGLCLTTKERKIMEYFHDLIFVPYVLFLAAILLPIVYYNGSTSDKVVTGAVLAVWIIGLCVDILTGRLDQIKFHRKLS